MRILYVLLLISIATVVVAIVAVWWRLRRHLHQSDEALKNTLEEFRSEPESIVKH